MDAHQFGRDSGCRHKWQGFIHNALLEAFTIHARVILKFLYDEHPRTGDVIAEDFFPTPQKWKEVRPEMTEILETIYRRVGEEVAHLTYARQYITAEAKKWRFLQIARDIDVRLKKFLGIVSEELLDEKWRKRYPHVQLFSVEDK